MKINVLTFCLLLTCCFYSCSSDPCDENMDSLECPTGDTDMDGIINSEDSDPSDPCLPTKPSFEDNLIGTWNYSFFGNTGQVKINADGTYEDLVNEIVSSGPITSRMWSIENGELRFAVQNASLQTGWLSYDCDSFVLDGQGLANITFSRV